jgi:hypothetical protein
MTVEKILIAEPVRGFTERDKNSKAILNTDVNSLLQYKIQKRKASELNKNASDINVLRSEVVQIKSDLSEIKSMLLQITNNNRR